MGRGRTRSSDPERGELPFRRAQVVRRRAGAAVGRVGQAPERGAATAELALATPLLITLVLLVVQFAIYQHAAHIAQAAAAQALAAARAEGGTPAAGHVEAAVLLDQLGRRVLTGPSTRVDRGPAAVTVTVTGDAEQVLPWLRLPVHAQAHGPVERWVTNSPTLPNADPAADQPASPTSPSRDGRPDPGTIR